MTPGRYNLIIYRGDTFGLRVILWTDTERTVPADLTGTTAKAEFRTRPGGTVLATFECVVELPNTITATLPPEVTELLTGNGTWDLQLTYASTGDVSTILAGAVSVTPDVTDSAPALPLYSGVLVS